MQRTSSQSRATLMGSPVGLGQVLLGVYIIVVIVLTLIRDTVGASFLATLASTPHALIHGAWWQLFTSGLIVDGPLLPQIVAVGVLGTLAIYFRGSWLFWLTALIGHILGTVVTYIGVGVTWLIHPAWVNNLLNQPDYGISLVWCAALGMVAAAAWLGPDSTRTPIYKPAVLVGVAVIMVLVTWFSPGLARYEHLAAFAIAFTIVTLTPQHRHISQRLAPGWRKPRRSA
jgi:membrane-bound metal-dependent hydrolase YbcI (DUF457 family)